MVCGNVHAKAQFHNAVFLLKTISNMWKTLTIDRTSPVHKAGSNQGFNNVMAI
jgi:hypothetical protein